MKKTLLILSLVMTVLSSAQAEWKVPEIKIAKPAQDPQKVFTVPAPSGGNDWPAVEPILKKAVAAGSGAKVVFQKGTYDFSETKFLNQGWHLNLENVSDLIIEGNGATVNMHPSNSFLKLSRCERVVVRGFVLHYSLPHHMQGDIVEVATDGSTMSVRAHAGYPYGKGFPENEKLPPLKGVGFIVDPATGEMMRLSKVGQDHFKSSSYTFDEETGLLHFNIVKNYQNPVSNLKPGDIYTALTYFNGTKENILVRRSTDCLFEDITAYSGSDMTVRPANNEGPIAMRRIIIKPRPGTKNLISTIRDGIHCRSNRGPMLIEECYFEKLMDDSINIFSLGYSCEKKTADGGLHASRPGNGEPSDYFRSGDKITLLDRTSGNYLGVLTVKKAVPEFKNDPERNNTYFTLYFEEELPEGIVYAPADGRRATELYNLNACGAGSLIRKNTFKTQRRYALLLSAPNSAFVENVVDGVQGAAVHGGTQGHYICGPIPSGAIVKDNIIKDTGWESIKFVTHGMVHGKFDVEKTPAKNFLIEGNQIECRYGDGVSLLNASDSMIRGNTFKISKKVEPGVKPVKLTGCVRVEAKNNVSQ